MPIDLGDFGDPALQLNAGFLRSSEAHVNLAHAVHLRTAVARKAGCPVEAIVAAQLVGLSRDGLEVQWVTADGAQRLELRFPEPARTVDELATRVRDALRLDLC